MKKEIDSLAGLKEELAIYDNAWLLLYKTGAEQSGCAFYNFSEAVEKQNGSRFLYANISLVRDIHTEYNITSLPTLLRFKKGKIVNVVKGCLKPEQYAALFNNAVFVSNNGEKKLTPQVTVFTTPTCSWCKTLKRHLETHGVQFREVDITKDLKAGEDMVRRSGQQGVPQADINGQLVVGFDRLKINSLLGIN